MPRVSRVGAKAPCIMKRITRDLGIKNLPPTAATSGVGCSSLGTEGSRATNFDRFRATDKPRLSARKRSHVKIDCTEAQLVAGHIKQEETADGCGVEVPNAASVKQESTPSVSPNKQVKMEHTIPPLWEDMLHNLREMRKNNDAPVDSMGCDMCMDKSSSPKDARYQLLLSLMLSSMTKDHVTFAAMQKLIKYGCTVDRMLEISDEQLADLIHPVNYWKKKVKFIKEATRVIKEEFDGDIPKTVKDLCRLKGVGPKMAHLCMKSAWGEITGIGVDTHVHRISNRMGWVESKHPEDTRRQLEGWLPQALWKEVNHLLVGFGQQICLPVKPQCATCLNNNICPFGVSQLKK